MITCHTHMHAIEKQQLLLTVRTREKCKQIFETNKTTRKSLIFPRKLRATTITTPIYLFATSTIPDDNSCRFQMLWCVIFVTNTFRSEAVHSLFVCFVSAICCNTRRLRRILSLVSVCLVVVCVVVISVKHAFSYYSTTP